MHDTTSFACEKCKEGHLTFLWKGEVHQYDGEEYDYVDWVEVTEQTCACEYTEEEVEDLCAKAEAKMTEAYEVWAKSQTTDDDMESLDVTFYYENFE